MLCAFLGTLALLAAFAGGTTAGRDRDPKTPIPDQPAAGLDARARDHATTALLEDRALLVRLFPRIRERPVSAASGPILPALEVFMTFRFEAQAIVSVVSAVS
jgi:hypothetical protein